MNAAKSYDTECTRCLGKGRITAYGHIIGGICFACEGKGYTTSKTSPEARAKAAARRKAKQQKAVEDKEARFQALKEKYAADPRISDKTKADEARMWDVVFYLEDVEQGKKRYYLPVGGQF